jgi:hypothetical protein
MTENREQSATTRPTAAGGGGDRRVKLGVLGECKGPFGGFHEDTVAGCRPCPWRTSPAPR